MNNINWKDYGGITKIANALRQYYDLRVFHIPDPIVLNWLEENHFRCIVALLIDAMGVSILHEHLKKDDFFLANKAEDITTVFPPTTSAATTSFRTGKSPCENGWLGWNQYFKEKDDNIILFINRSQYADKTYQGYSYNALPLDFISDELSKAGTVNVNIWPTWGTEHNTYSNLLHRTAEATQNKQTRFVYAYWDQFDSLMHQKGPSSIETGEMLRTIQAQTEKFAVSLPSDCGLIILADHSQIDVRHAYMPDELTRCFAHAPALEPRTIAFYIKDDMKDEFVNQFQILYGKDFHLYAHEEVVKEHIFGPGIPSSRFEEFIGDYLAIGTSNLQLLYGSKKYSLGDHAGGLKEEAMIPVILYPAK